MKCQNLFSGKNKENVISLLSAELAQRVVAHPGRRGEVSVPLFP